MKYSDSLKNSKPLYLVCKQGVNSVNLLEKGLDLHITTFHYFKFSLNTMEVVEIGSSRT